MMGRRGFLLTLVTAFVVAFDSPLAAQTFPSHPITIVAPFPAGGPIDVVARLLAERMREQIGQPVVVDNVTGASGSIGVGKVARAPGDGYTIVLGNWATFVVNGAIYPLQYDLVKDFEPIGLITTQPYLIVGRKTLPADDLKSLITWLKANGDKATEATSGAGTPAHLAGVLFQKETGTHFQFVPYRGLAPAMQDVVASHIDLIFDSPVSSLPQIRAGTVKAFAVMAKKRASAAPDIPTVDEAGLPGAYVSSWYGIWTSKGTPADIVAKLNTFVMAALNDPQTRERISDLGQEIAAPEMQNPAALGAFQQAEIAKWWPILKEMGIKGE
ncbi:MAG TPA: tripartite tricarboxylate transporter substrate-binding protein [Xanthobacteraceae bacterium]|jgi:tripartite-type tricarboxylate transporter receptor subunit TctC|nr:tripartite tricarboxylate transporter substrate-binding protein [Xanthobacteraceae bacterium]